MPQPCRTFRISWNAAARITLLGSMRSAMLYTHSPRWTAPPRSSAVRIPSTQTALKILACSVPLGIRASGAVNNACNNPAQRIGRRRLCAALVSAQHASNVSAASSTTSASSDRVLAPTIAATARLRVRGRVHSACKSRTPPNHPSACGPHGARAGSLPHPRDALLKLEAGFVERLQELARRSQKRAREARRCDPRGDGSRSRLGSLIRGAIVLMHHAKLLRTTRTRLSA